MNHPTPTDAPPRTPLAWVVVESFGYGHAAAPLADVTVDTRASLRNPHHDPAMRFLTGLDESVRRHVMTTAGAAGLAAHLTLLAVGMVADLDDIRQRQVRVAIGCVGGRHRSVALAEEVTARLRTLGVPAEVSHRDITKPVLTKGQHR
ncbi:RapZ C-terminal domain-containing protein [Streptosporangium sp. NBC_01469]|uniref:RapZ C-terminal domain-containing protein n=1 Tax=Streptosporangium sp. NBC_01469 TaxID=2903898 RepID=UPI002E2DE378|nr:RNase adapter RapZ [Streptosporangium sp. NBC_01469]